MSSGTILAYVVAVPLIIWAGIFVYLLGIDRALRRVEQQGGGEDEL